MDVTEVDVGLKSRCGVVVDSASDRDGAAAHVRRGSTECGIISKCVGEVLADCASRLAGSELGSNCAAGSSGYTTQCIERDAVAINRASGKVDSVSGGVGG